jgi:bromodomain-containing protein 7/9
MRERERSHGPKEKKPLRFTYYQADVPPAPRIILQYSLARSPTPQRVTFSATKQKGAVPLSKKPPPTGLARVLADLIRKVSQKDVHKLFAAPVTEDIAPGYFAMIKNPIDLSAIRAKVHDDEYQSLQQFKDDMKLMFDNCTTYNPPNSFVWVQGIELWNFFKRVLKDAKQQLTGESVPTFASSIRTASGAETSHHLRTISQVNIPVKIERKSRPAPFSGDLPIPAEGNASFFYIPHTEEEYVRYEARLESVYDLVAQSGHIRDSLNLLKDRFSDFIVEDAVRTLAGVDASCDVDMQSVGEALQSGQDLQDGLGIGEAVIQYDAVHALKMNCSELGL